MGDVKLGELNLERPESHTDHNAVREDNREGSKNCMDWITSSQAILGIEGRMEGSTIREMRSPTIILPTSAQPLNQFEGDDMICPTVKAVEVGIKNPTITMSLIRVPYSRRSVCKEIVLIF
jgi:hypothetical protein